MLPTHEKYKAYGKKYIIGDSFLHSFIVKSAKYQGVNKFLLKEGN